MRNGILLVLLLALVIGGCVNKNENVNMGVKEQKNVENEVKDIKKLTLIEDIESWRNPAKEYFNNKNIKLIKAEIAEDKSYTVFYIEGVDETYFINRKFIKGIAEVNGYKDFKIASDEHFADVKCDKIQELIKNVTTDFATIDFKETKKENKIVESKSEDKSEKKEKLTSKQENAIEIAEKYAKKHLKECGYEEGITNMSVDSEEGNDVVLKVWNKGSTSSETIDWLIVNVSSGKVSSENFGNN